MTDVTPTEKVRWRNGRLIVQDPRSGYWATRSQAQPRDPVVHMLKCVQPYFDEVKLGRKPFELRRADRDFRMFDTCWFREFDAATGEYGRGEHLARIGYILDDYRGALDPDYVIFGLIPLPTRTVEYDDMLRAARKEHKVYS